VGRLAQLLKPPTTAALTPTSKNVLVLSGGGVYGAAQAGMLKALVASGYRPDAIVGVSAGALNGSFIASEYSVARAIELVDIWCSVDRKAVFPSGALSQVVHLIAGRDAVQSAKGVRQLVERFAPVSLEDCEIPVHVGATDLTTGICRWWSEGESVSRLCASAALPGVVPPVVIDGERFVDGGVVANVPLSRASEIGATHVVVLDVSTVERDQSTPDSALAVLLRAFAHTRQALQHHELRSLPEHVSLLHIHAPLPSLMPSDFSRSRELATIGEQAVVDALESLHHGFSVQTLSDSHVQDSSSGYSLRARTRAVSQRLRRGMSAPSTTPDTTPTPTASAIHQRL
jgi:NTE family protein